MDDKVFQYLRDMARAHIDRNIRTQNTYIDIDQKDTAINAYIAGLVAMYNNFASPNLLLDMIGEKLFVSEVRYTDKKLFSTEVVW